MRFPPFPFVFPVLVFDVLVAFAIVATFVVVIGSGGVFVLVAFVVAVVVDIVADVDVVVDDAAVAFTNFRTGLALKSKAQILYFRHIRIIDI